jgi:hypothetical protein
LAINNMLARIGTAEGDLTRMKMDIGTHDTGLRGEVHNHATMLSQHELRLGLIERGKT